MNIGQWLQRVAQVSPDRSALFLGKEMIATYGQFHDAACRVAGWLARQGVLPGDRVAIFMKNCPEYLMLQYGIWYAGAAIVPINAKLHAREAAWIVENSGAKFCFADPKMTGALSDFGVQVVDVSVEKSDIFQGDSVEYPVGRQSRDLAWLFYTSGTTGRPKGVMITHRMLITMSLSYLADVDDVDPEDTAIYAAPLSHGAGIYNMIHVRQGARHVCPVSGGFSEAEIFDLSRHFGRAHMFAAPTMVKRLVESARATGEDGAGIRTIVYGGGPMYVADIIDAIAIFGAVFVQIYGQGECPMGISSLGRAEIMDRSHPNWKGRLASVGRAQSSVEVMIGDSEGRAVPMGTVGEIMVRGDVVMPGYWGNPETTKKTIINEWLMTGDLGFLDADGYLTMQDRSKDLIISGGTNIYPREVEEVPLLYDGVEEVSVVGAPDTEWGEVVVAFVVPRQGIDITIEMLDSHCLQHIARFKRPKRYVMVESLPKNNYGKVLKTELRDKLLL